MPFFTNHRYPLVIYLAVIRMRTVLRARAGTAPEQHVLPYLVEDRGPGTPSYQDFATMLHRAVLSKG